LALRLRARRSRVTIAFFGIAGFSFLITQYFQFFKGYGPLSTGVRLLPVAFAVGITDPTAQTSLDHYVRPQVRLHPL
jgi:hypothetical protein